MCDGCGRWKKGDNNDVGKQQQPKKKMKKIIE
jgi:hypothetical protein